MANGGRQGGEAVSLDPWLWARKLADQTPQVPNVQAGKDNLSPC